MRDQLNDDHCCWLLLFCQRQTRVTLTSFTVASSLVSNATTTLRSYASAVIIRAFPLPREKSHHSNFDCRWIQLQSFAASIDDVGCTSGTIGRGNVEAGQSQRRQAMSELILRPPGLFWWRNAQSLLPPLSSTDVIAGRGGHVTGLGTGAHRRRGRSEAALEGLMGARKRVGARHCSPNAGQRRRGGFGRSKQHRPSRTRWSRHIRTQHLEGWSATSAWPDLTIEP